MNSSRMHQILVYLQNFSCLCMFVFAFSWLENNSGQYSVTFINIKLLNSNENLTCNLLAINKGLVALLKGIFSESHFWNHVRKMMKNKRKKAEGNGQKWNCQTALNVEIIVTLGCHLLYHPHALSPSWRLHFNI